MLTKPQGNVGLKIERGIAKRISLCSFIALVVVGGIRILIIGALTTLSGCFATHLESFTPPAHLPQLVNSAEVTMPLDVRAESPESSHGYQFLLSIIPITRVFPDSLTNIVRAKLTTHAGFARYGLVSAAPHSLQTPRLEVAIPSVGVYGYDFILVRRPSARVSLLGTLHTANGVKRECAAEGAFSEFSRFAFAEQLENALEQACDQAALRLLQCFGFDIPDPKNM